jgi:hypothetical protein
MKKNYASGKQEQLLSVHDDVISPKCKQGDVKYALWL